MKILLLKGAERQLRNTRGNIPIELIDGNECRDELMRDLRPPTFWKCFMLSVPLTKMRKEWSTLIYFIIFMVFLQFWFIMLFYPLMIDSSRAGIWTVDLILITFMLIFYAIATIKGNLSILSIDPGYLKPDPSIDFQSLLCSTDPYNICPDCKVLRTPRSRH